MYLPILIFGQTKKYTSEQIKEALVKPDSWTVDGYDEYLIPSLQDGGCLKFKSEGIGNYTTLISGNSFTWSIKPNNILIIEVVKTLPKEYIVDSITEDEIKLKTNSLQTGNSVIITLKPEYDDDLLDYFLDDFI